MVDDDLTRWTTEALRDCEARLYTQEVAGEYVWLWRDRVLWELARRRTEELIATHRCRAG